MITINKIQDICSGTIILDGYKGSIKNFSKDTREINKGDFYIGIQGDNYNGSDYFEDALIKGASGCILQNVNISEDIKAKYKDKSIIVVEDTIIAIQKLAEYKRNQYNIPVIAVTGSVGKTSTKELISSVLSSKYKVLKTEGNYNNHIGLPLTLLKLDDQEVIVVEMGMNHSKEISLLTKIAKPTIAIITNIGTSHIGNLGSRKSILEAKLEILEGLDKNGSLIINNDDDMLHDWYKTQSGNKVFTYGIKNDSTIVGYDIHLADFYSDFKTELNEEKYEFRISVGGEHFIYNAIASILIGKMLSVNVEDIKDTLRNFENVNNRMQIVKNSVGAYILNDSYNASLDSIKPVLSYISNFNAKRKIVVLGDILELGKFSEETHKNVGKEVSNNKIDILITVGKEAEHIADEVQNTNKDITIYSFKENEEAIEKINSIIEEDDIVLLKASNGMNFKEIYESIK